jgi:hypothetical protein
LSARLSLARVTATSALHRLKLAIADLERATVERDLKVARYLLDTEVAEALQAIDLAGIAEDWLVADLVDAVEAVRVVLRRDPR